MEIQFSDRGRMIGAKILNYLVNKKTVISNKSNFHVFYYLLSGATTTEKEALHLTDRYRYAPNYNFTEQNVEHYEALKVALKQIGLGKKNHFHIMQLLAAILHLGQLQFVDDTSVQEAACIKNTETLDLVSDFLGVDPQTLENVMTYKTQLIKNDVTTLILNADLAAKQRDELSIVLYSLLFNWMVEQLNGKLCSDDTHNFISILDFPGATLTPSMLSFDDFCLNYCNERIQNYIQTQVFEINGAEYKEDGLDYPTMDECSGNTECIDLFDQRRSGVIDIINNYSKKSKTSNRVKTDADMFDTLVRYHSDHPSFQVKKSETGAQLFAIQHFHGEQSYQPNGFLESNRDELNPDFITLFQGAAGISPSTNEFLARLFKDKSIHTESHPKQSDAIFNAQQVNKPVRSPSTRRSKSTRKQNKEGNDDGDDTKIKALDKSNVSVALAQLRSSMDELFSTLSETMPWFVFCIQATSSAATFDSQLVKNQVQIRNLLQIVKRSQIGSFPNVYLHNDFCERYHDILLDVGVEQDISQSAQCEALAMGLGWERDTDFAIGNAKVK
jgi:chitin synthase